MAYLGSFTFNTERSASKGIKAETPVSVTFSTNQSLLEPLGMPTASVIRVLASTFLRSFETERIVEDESMALTVAITRAPVPSKSSTWSEALTLCVRNKS